MISIVKGKEDENSIKLKIRKDNELFFREQFFRNYFYIKQEDFNEIQNNHNFERYFSDIEEVEAKNGTFVKLYLNNNFHRNFARKFIEENDIETFEADINSYKRFIVDNQDVELNHKHLKRLWLDIETVDLEKLKTDFMTNKIEANSPILSIAMKDDQTKETFYFYNEAIDNLSDAHKEKLQEIREEYLDRGKRIPKIEYVTIIEKILNYEKRLIEKMYDFIRQYDLVLAWNGKGFDFQYIQQRMKKYGYDYYDMMVNDMDYMEVFKNSDKGDYDNYKLETISYEVLKDELNGNRFKNIEEIKKIDWKEKTNAKRYIDLYLFYPQLLREYNIQDVNLMDMIEQKKELLRLHNVQSDISRCSVNNTIHDSYNSDYLLLNEYKKINFISPSKPNEEEREQRKEDKKRNKPPGGFTYVFEKGLFYDLYGFDFKSQYPTAIITYNISYETLIGKINPMGTKEFKEIFTDEEISYMNFAFNQKWKYIDKKGELNTKKYEKDVDPKYMKKLMWRFVRNYKMKEASQKAKDEDFIFTPADINYDSKGWAIHPHYCFSRKEGVAPKIERKLLQERDKVKYNLKSVGEGTDEYKSNDAYQGGLKVSANSLYGGFGFDSFRYYRYEIPTAITTASRYLTKRSIVFANENGFSTTNGDTDSAYLKKKEEGLLAKDLEEKFYFFYQEYIKPFNTSCEIELLNPKTKQMESNNHYLVFEHEKTLPACIVVAKKRYYYVEDDKIKTQGGAFKRKETLKIAAEIQKELVKDLLTKNFNKDIWFDKIKRLKEKVYNFGLDEEDLIKTSTLTKPTHEFGKPIIDGNTGKQKVRKSDGKPMFSPIPAHIQIAKKLVAEGYDLEVDDKIKYIVIGDKPIIPITIEEYRKEKRYDAKYYWERIESVLIEILSVVDKELCFKYFRDFWTYTDKKIKRMVENR